MLLEKDKMLICSHCGDSCDSDISHLEGPVFCCHGCEIVWQLLHEKGLADYYDIEDVSGLSRQDIRPRYYDFLDDPEIEHSLISFSVNHLKTVYLGLPQIHCSSCVWLLERLYLLEGGVKNVRVNFLEKKATIAFDDTETSLRSIVELLDKIGYAPNFEKEGPHEKKTPDQNKVIIYKIGVAGFCFGNIMLLSFPDYLGTASSSFANFFGILNILLSIPVVFYAGSDYLKSAWDSLTMKRIGIDVPISIGMLTLFFRSIYEITITNNEGYLDSLAGFVFFLLIGSWIHLRTFAGISFERDFKSFFPIAVKFWTGENWMSKSIDLLKKKDRILIRNGEIIPCDGLVSKGSGSVDYSFVTGESKLVSLSKGMAVSSGGKLINSSFEIIVEKEVNQGELTQLWNDDIFNKRELERESTLLNIIGMYFTISILVIGIFSLLFWLYIDPTKAFNIFTAVLIIACPCVLALSIPFLYGSGIRWLSKLSIFSKNVFTIFDLNDIDTIVFDKTGTLTDTNKAIVQFIGIELSQEEKSMIRSVSQHSSHKLSEMISNYCGEGSQLEVQYFKELSGKGIEAFIFGKKIEIGSGTFVHGYSQNHSLQSSFVKIDGTVRGCFQFEHSIRIGMKEMIQKLNKEYCLSVLSGDASKDQNKIENIFPRGSDLLFNQSPQQKMDYVKALQNQGKKVMMIGDGLNDSGALKQSDIGVVISSEENNFTPSADLIMLSDKLSLLPQLFQFSRLLKYGLYGAFLLALLYNSIGLGFAVSSKLTPVVAAILMPISSVSIMLYGLGMSWIAMRLSFQTKT